MAEWQAPIFDRTQADIEYAKHQLALGINDIEYKGCFNPSDILRIENNTQYLSDMLNELYYKNAITTKNNWTKESTITLYHVLRIINNIDVLWRAYYRPTSSYDLPETLLRFEQVNMIEENIYLLRRMIDRMIASFRECGTFNCGEEW